MFHSRFLSSILKRNKPTLSSAIYYLKGKRTSFQHTSNKENPSRFFSQIFRSLHNGNKGNNAPPSIRNVTATASVGAESRERLTVLVNGGTCAKKMVGIWLFGSAAWVFSMVVLGGVTRLTRSGLSMTDWKFSGQLPPLSDEDWIKEFEKYKQSPEYKCVNRGMKIEDFKFIYWMEYAHRMWGRALGIMFALPFSYFLRKGYITLPLGLRLSALFGLGAGDTS